MQCQPPDHPRARPSGGRQPTHPADDRRQRAKQYWSVRRASNNCAWIWLSAKCKLTVLWINVEFMTLCLTNNDLKICTQYHIFIEDLILDLTFGFKKFKFNLKNWNLDQWFKSIPSMIWDLTVIYDLRFANHCIWLPIINCSYYFHITETFH